MPFTYPKSFLTLLLIGFSLVALPFLFAFANAALYLDNITQQSRVAVTQAIQATRDSRALIEQLSQMERDSLQYMTSGNTALLNSYIQAHHRFDETAAALGAMLDDKAQQDTLSTLTRNVDVIGVQMALGDPEILRQLLPEFAQLSKQANAILAASNRMIDQETASLQSAAERAQKALMWQALSLIPFTLLATMAIAYLIARPLHQIDQAIHDLGNGKLSEEINVSGPEDLKKLGERLDWLRKQLTELENQKNRFLREVSHELKTPLTAIREGAELLNEGIAGQLSAQQREISGILHDNSVRLQRMIEDLLNYSAARFQTSPVMEKVALHEVLEIVLSNHALPIATRQIHLNTHIEKTTLTGDKNRLSTLCDNLVSNAVKFAPQGGKVQVILHADDHRAILEVMDNGPGIAAEDRPHLFEPFFQGSAPQDSHVKGSGLGLSIAFDCAVAHGGMIEVIDIPSWQGAHFQVALPMEPPVPPEDEI